MLPVKRIKLQQRQARWLEIKVAQQRSPCSRRVIFALGTRGRVYAVLPVVNARPIQSKMWAVRAVAFAAHSLRRDLHEEDGLDGMWESVHERLRIKDHLDIVLCGQFERERVEGGARVSRMRSRARVCVNVCSALWSSKSLRIGFRSALRICSRACSISDRSVGCHAQGNSESDSSTLWQRRKPPGSLARHGCVHPGTQRSDTPFGLQRRSIDPTSYG